MRRYAVDAPSRLSPLPLHTRLITIYNVRASLHSLLCKYSEVLSAALPLYTTCLTFGILTILAVLSVALFCRFASASFLGLYFTSSLSTCFILKSWFCLQTTTLLCKITRRQLYLIVKRFSCVIWFPSAFILFILSYSYFSKLGLSCFDRLWQVFFDRPKSELQWRFDDGFQLNSGAKLIWYTVVR